MQTNSPRDARRRNRNIGTAKAGHGQNNRNVIPRRQLEGVRYYERLTSPVVVTREFGDHIFTFIVEPTREGSFHCCTVDDVCEVLRLLPERHHENIALIIFRQPTRRQETLRSVWGRMAFARHVAGHSGTAIYLDAQEVPWIAEWPRCLSLDEQQELERLRRDGHHVESQRRGHVIRSGADAIRATQLFRTLPHEVGHNVDYNRFYERADAAYSSTDPGFDYVLNRYDARPTSEREAFAHRYADEFRQAMIDAGHFPFPQIRDEERMRLSGLDPDWFAVTSSDAG
jgi:hypothetical protein